MSVIYDIKCECGSSLGITGSMIDKDHDVTLTVEKCEDCYQAGYEQSQKDAEE